MNDKNKKLLSAARLWAMSNGMQELEKTSEAIFFNNAGKTCGFTAVTETAEPPLGLLQELKEHCSTIYIITNSEDNALKLRERLPKEFIVISYSMSSYLGYEFELFKPILN